jgi:hypothetical protein
MLRRSKLSRGRTWARTWREEQWGWRTRMVLQTKVRKGKMNFEWVGMIERRNLK